MNGLKTESEIELLLKRSHMKKNKTTTAIIFDLGGVLINWDPRGVYKKLFNGDEEKLDYFFSTVCPFDWNISLDAGYSFDQGIQDRIALYPAYEPYIKAWKTRWSETITGEILGTVDILKSIKETGYSLYALSNWSAETFPIVYERFEFLSWFEDVILSGEEKLVKPNPEIYHRLTARIKTAPENCLFIDDSEKNIEAAHELGFQTIHFTNPEDLASEMKQRKIIS